VIARPLHPYTHGLIGSVPSANRRGTRLTQIPGMTPSLLDLPAGCAFRSRCPFAGDDCRADPPMLATAAGRAVRCVRPLSPVPA
jgi:peptide/nickel transport system ATP-binding protein